MKLEPDSILVIRRDNIGDLVCTTPLIRALRQALPKARIDAFANSYNLPVLAGNPDLDHAYAYTKAKHRQGDSILGVHWQRFKLMWQLRRQHYDLAILAGDGDQQRAMKLARWIRPRQVAGFVAPGSQSPLGLDLPVVLDDRPRHAVEIAGRLLEPLGLAGELPALHVVPEPGAAEAARRLLAAQSWFRPETPTIAIHISARKVPQRWPEPSFASLMGRLHAAYGVQFMLFWSPGDDDNPLHPGDDRKAAAILDATRALPVLAYPTHHLRDLIGGLSCCHAMICSDGGAMHLGAGLGLPIVCFFGNSDPVRWRPWGVPQVVLQPPSRNVQDIGVDEAFAAFGQLWKDME
ncbi:MAG: glycosyltransferase family 9 protein [Actinomycetota bacterium]